MIPCRCSNSRCRTRRSLPRHPDAYVRPPKCRTCGSALLVDGHRQRQRRLPAYMRTDPAPVCLCDGAMYPHRRGWVPLCRHRLDRIMETQLRGRGVPQLQYADGEPGF